MAEITTCLEMLFLYSLMFYCLIIKYLTMFQLKY